MKKFKDLAEARMKGSDPCWTGYQMVGTKKKGGKTVPNCVPVNEVKEVGDDPTGDTPPENLVRKGTKVVTKQAPFEEQHAEKGRFRPKVPYNVPVSHVVSPRKDMAEETEILDELSNNLLSRYKAAAGSDASKADKSGDYNKGDKRFKGIMTATKKQFNNDMKNEAKDVGEYDQEGDMAKSDLRSIIANAQKLHGMIEDADNLPEWCQNKITLAEDYISTVANYLMAEMNESTEQLEEGRPSQRHPLEGHEYHKKSNAELEYIAKDAHKAAEAMKSHNTTAENKYRDQANDSATVRYFRQKNGMPDWYKKKYGHIKEDTKQDDKSSTALSGLVAKKNLKQAEGKNKSQAFIDKMTNKVNAAKRLKEEDAYDKDVKPSDKPYDKDAAAKRAKIAAVMARRKMAKEEVEQIDEISTKTLAKAASAASDPDADYHYGKSHDPQKFADHAKKTKDAKSAAAVQGAADAKGHYTRPGHSLGSYDKLAHRTPARVTGAGKANKQDVNKLKKSISLNAEEVEQLDELSPSTLQSYKVAGHKKYDSIRNNTDDASMAKKSKLEKGIKTAHAKQYPSKPAAPAPKKDPNSRGYEQGRYMGDSVEHDESLVEGESWKVDTGWKKSKSDDVTDKSGAKHTAMSRAKHLAKMAAKRNAQPTKSMREDAEPIEQGPEEAPKKTRKAQIVKDAKKTTSDKFQSEPELGSTITKNY